MFFIIKNQFIISVKEHTSFGIAKFKLDLERGPIPLLNLNIFHFEYELGTCKTPVVILNI